MTHLEIVDRHLRVARRLKKLAEAAAVAAEKWMDALCTYRRRLPSGTHDDEVGPPELDGVLKDIALKSPIASIVWLASGGRSAKVCVNDTISFELAKRLDTILEILYAQPRGPDGIAAFIDYDVLRKEVGKREGRRVTLRALSQSLYLLAEEFGAHMGNRFYIDRDPPRKRVRLLIRKPPVLAAAVTYGGSSSRVIGGGADQAQAPNRPVESAPARGSGRRRLV